MKTIIAFVLAFLLMASTVSSFGLPMVISGHIENEGSLEGFEVTLRIVGSDEKMTVVTQDDGHFLFELGNLPVRDGDSFEITTEGQKIVVDDFNYNTYAPYEVLFDFHGVVSPKCEEPVECPAPDCPDCQVCEEPEPCPECPVVVCPTPVECPEPDPVDDNRAVELLIASIAGAAIAGSAVSITLGSKAKHYHRGIRDKHSIYTRHRDATIRHPIGEVVPVYKKVGDNYVYVPKEDR